MNKKITFLVLVGLLSLGMVNGVLAQSLPSCGSGPGVNPTTIYTPQTGYCNNGVGTYNVYGTVNTTPPPASSNSTQSNGVNGTSLSSCAFPSGGFNSVGYEAIGQSCQQMFASQYTACKAAGNVDNCKYSNQNLAFNCQMPGSGLGGPGFCAGAYNPPGCIQHLSQADLAQAVGASCSSVSGGSSGSTGSTGITGLNSQSCPTILQDAAKTANDAINTTNSLIQNSLATPTEITALSGGLRSLEQTLSAKVLASGCGTIAFAPIGTGNIPNSSASFPWSTNANTSPTLLINGMSGGQYAIGAPWTLTLTSGIPSTFFTLCAIDNNSVQSCTPNWGTTDANGNWTKLSSFDISTAGPWTEWIVFPNGTMSTQIAFNVGNNTGPQPQPANPNIVFPATILVTSPVLNVRSAPNTSASLAGLQEFHAGDTFTAVNEVTGENVVGVNLWWVTSDGNYVWSRGTQVVPISSSGGPSDPTICTAAKAAGLGTQLTTLGNSLSNLENNSVPVLQVQGTLNDSYQGFLQQYQGIVAQITKLCGGGATTTQ
jgi:hypothetical protein